MSDRPIEGKEVTELLEALGQLKSIIEEQLSSIHNRLEHVTEVVREAVEQLGVLSDIEDEKREEFQWAARNYRLFQITSMPADPASSDWAQQINKFTSADVPPEPDRPSATRNRGDLWPDDKK